MTEHLRTPGLADQVVMLKNAAVCFELCTCLQCENKVLMPQTDELGQVTVVCNSGGMIE